MSMDASFKVRVKFSNRGSYYNVLLWPRTFEDRSPTRIHLTEQSEDSDVILCLCRDAAANRTSSPHNRSKVKGKVSAKMGLQFYEMLMHKIDCETENLARTRSHNLAGRIRWKHWIRYVRDASIFFEFRPVNHTEMIDSSIYSKSCNRIVTVTRQFTVWQTDYTLNYLPCVYCVNTTHCSRRPVTVHARHFFRFSCDTVFPTSPKCAYPIADI